MRNNKPFIVVVNLLDYDKSHKSIDEMKDSDRILFSLCVLLIVDQDQDLLFQHHRREFRFDLSRIPEGEAITAAEFRIYKGFTQERYENETFRVSVYQVLQEPPNRYDCSLSSYCTCQSLQEHHRFFAGFTAAYPRYDLSCVIPTQQLDRLSIVKLFIIG